MAEDIKHKRNLSILLDRIHGETLEVIGEKYGITKEAVRKIVITTFDRLVSNEDRFSEVRVAASKELERLNKAIEQLRSNLDGCSPEANKRTSRHTRSPLGASKGSNSI